MLLSTAPIVLNNMLIYFIYAKKFYLSEQIALLKLIYTLASMLLIVLLECIVNRSFLWHTNLTSEKSQPFCYSLPIALALCVILSGIYYAKNYAGIISLGLAVTYV